MKKRLYLVQTNNRYGDNVYLPYSVGLLWAYARTIPRVADAWEMAGFVYLKEPIDAAVARLESPDLVAISCYIWNWRWSLAFAAAVKERWPECLILVGGVQIQDGSPKTLEDHPQIDLAIYGEGEGAFADLLCELAGEDPNLEGLGSLIWRDGSVAVRVNAHRTYADIDKLRSPYLDGVFDSILGDGWKWQAAQETNRGCPYACVAGDSYVALPDRILRPDREKIESGTISCPVRGHVHRQGSDDIRVMHQGAHRCVTIGLSNGLSMTVTGNHHVHCVDNENIVEVKAESVSVGMSIVLEIGQNAVSDERHVPALPEIDRSLGGGRRIPNEVKLPSHFNDDLAWITGYIIGDGCLPADGRPSVIFAVKDRSRPRLRSSIASVFGLDLAEHAASNTDRMTHGAIHSRRVVDLFKLSIGMRSGYEKLCVPDIVFRSPSRVVREFLNGLYAADGYQTPDSGLWYLSTISETLAHEVAALIYWIGDGAVVRKCKPAGFSKGINYRIEWHDDTCRSRQLGKPCLLMSVPINRDSYRDRKGKARWRSTNSNNRCGISRNLLSELDPGHILLNDKYAYVTVTSVTSNEDPVDVYDVHNHPMHTITVNGTLTSNCTFCAWGASALDKVRSLDMARILDEIKWFATNKCGYVENCDANFGILPRDSDIVDAMVASKAACGYPQRFRAAWAKNSNDKVASMARRLHGADMLKAVTLSVQSMDEKVLTLVRRKNIKYERMAELIAGYDADGIPTYSELIMGMPGETYDSFVDGIDKLLDAGQHNGLFMYPCMLLPNTEMNTPEYIALHGIKSVPVRAMLLHGIPEPGAVHEIQDLVVETSTMPHGDWLRTYVYSWLIQGYHSCGLLQHAAMAARALGIRYRDFYEPLMIWAMLMPSTVVGRELHRFQGLLRTGLAGGSWDLIDKRFGEISWPPEEFSYLMTLCDSDRFYDELMHFVSFTVEQTRRARGERAGKDSTPVLEALVDQRRMIRKPPPGGEAEWAREAVWYGRKGSGAKQRIAS